MADQKSRFSLFGFRIGKKEDELKQELVQPSFTPPSNEDGALTITSAAQFGTSALDLDGSAKNEIELITRYREMAMQPEVESAIEDIVNEAIVRNDEGKNVEIVLDDLKQSDKIKKAIREEFDTILKLLNYDNMGTDIFRRYYVDGRLNYHVIVDVETPQKGIQELRYIDPRKIRKIREVKKQKDSVSGVEVITKVDEYYVFAERITTGPTNSPIGGVKIAPDSILNVNSGLMDAKRGMVLSYLHKAIKPLNQLRMIEDAVVIYRLSRAPERRVFYVDVGNLPRIKAEQYVRDIMTKYKNKLVYDACLDLNTMIPLMDGRKLLLKEIIMEYKEGKELWAYSCNPETGEFAPGLITWAGVTKLDQRVVRIKLENRKEIICTLDHKFPIWNKGFVEAKDLDYDDVLMTFNGENDSDKEKGMKVVEMEILKETMNVGTLTIDGEEIHHDYHTFALDVGVYTKNSTGEVRDDRRHLSMTEDFWMPRRCLRLNTKIKLLDGRDETLETLIKEHEEGKQNWVYSVAPDGTIVPGKISWAGITRKNTDIVKVTLDNGEIIECTPDHKFILRDGSLCEAQNLPINQSLMPLYTRRKKLSAKYSGIYDQVWNNKSGRWNFTHRLVSTVVNGEKNINEVVHHVDFNRYNNNPENLRLMDKLDHFKLHSEQGTNAHKNSDTEEWYRKLSESGKNFFNTEKGEQRKKEISVFNLSNENIINGLEKGRKIIQEMREFDKQNLSKEEFYEKWVYVAPLLEHNEKTRIKKDTFDFDLVKQQIDKAFYAKVQRKEIVSSIQEIYPDFKELTLTKFLRCHGYKNLFGFLKEHYGDKYKRGCNLNYNHKVVSVEFLSEKQDTGTLTIDENHEIHSYHNFGLSCGIFVKNSDNKSTEITTLPAGQNLGEMSDVAYFEKKLYKSLNVPVSRLDPQQAVSIGRSTEITRDELKFSRFIDKLRTKFSELFDNALRVQLILKGICTEEEWKEFKESICYDFIKDNKFVELKEAELMQERLGILAIIDQYSGKYYSKHWIQKNVLRLKDAEIEQMEQQIEEEKEIDFSDQAEEQQKQIQLQAQAMQLQNELMPQQEPQIDANAPEEQQQQGGGSSTDAARALHNTEREQLAKRKPNNPYHIQQ